MKTQPMKLASFIRVGIRGSVAFGAGLALVGVAAAQDEAKPENPQPQTKPITPPKVDPAATMLEPVPVDQFRKQFRHGLQIAQTFSLEDQLLTYHKDYVFRDRPFMHWFGDSDYDSPLGWDSVLSARPIANLGRQMYKEGPLEDYPPLFGKLNPFTPHLMVYGDWRTAGGYSKNQNNEKSRIATRLNLDVDAQLTSTERIHAFFRPLENKRTITNVELGGADGGGHDDDVELDMQPDTLFLEGDLGPITQGITGKHNTADLPFAIGKIPLFFQNGVWFDDAFVGAAFTIPAMNSAKLDISNMDVTAFVGVDDVTSGAIKDSGLTNSGLEGGTKMVGVASFIETHSGYAEIDYGYTVNNDRGADADSHNFSAAWTKRYWNWLSNSVRVILNGGNNTKEGQLILCENSFRTPQPYTLLPYFNFFAGFGTPESLARDGGAGGVLKNTGINFEADALTLFPKLDDSGHDRIGAALGVEYLPNLFTAPHRQQIVLEVAALTSSANDTVVGGKLVKDTGDELGVGVRYQIALSSSWIFRCDAMVAGVENGDNLSGFRVEIRKKW